MAKRKNRNGNGGSDAMGDALDSSDDLAMGADVSATDASDTGMGSDMDMSSDTGASGTSAHGAVDRLREGAAGASDRFRNSAEHLKEQAREQATQLAHQAKEQGQQYVDQYRSQLVDQVSGISSAIRASASQLQQNNVPVAGYVESLADQVDRVADWARNKELAEVARDVTSFARRHPEVVLGGMFVAGIAVARFLKAARPTTPDYSYGGTGATGYTRDADFDTDYDAGSSEMGFEESDVYAGTSAPVADVQPTGTMGATDAIGESSSMGITTNDPTGVNAFPTPGTSPTGSRGGAGAASDNFNP